MPTNRSEAMVATAVAQRDGAWATWRRLPRAQRVRVSRFAGYIAFLTLLFIQPLIRLTVYASQNDLWSYILLVPFISGYLLYIGRGRSIAYYRSIAGTAALGGIGIAALAAAIEWRDRLSVNDELALMALAYVGLVVAGGFLFLGSKWMAASAFPISFLAFLIPLPDAVVSWLEQASVTGSTAAAAMFFNLTGTPQVHHGTVFELPGIVIQVALACSGIHSSWVLFISSLLVGHVCLKTRWRRIALVAFVIPLGILRNGFRILVIGLLCVHIGPYMIDSSIHHKGGPLFFALSLVPLTILLWWLISQEKRLNPRG